MNPSDSGPLPSLGLFAARRIGQRIRTGRHFRVSQLAAYGLDRTLRGLEGAAPFGLQRMTRLLPGPRVPDREALAQWGARPEAVSLAPAWRPSAHGDPREGRWRFQEVERRWPDGVDWAARDMPDLWRFNLNYLDPVAALVAAEPGGDWQPWLTDLLTDHWERCRPGRGVAWTPFVLAVRLQNLLRIQALLAARGGASRQLEGALSRHTRAGFHCMRARLEHHLQANHLLKERCALVCGSRIWGGSGLQHRLVDRLRCEVNAQFLSGGGHEERSLRYHLDCLRDLAEVRAAMGAPAPAWLDDALARGLAFAEALEHPDGDIALFNDSELDATVPRSTLSDLTGWAGTPTEGLTVFEEEGYIRWRRSDCHLVVDCGPVAADHQPAHAHCDILSFEFSHAGRRIVGNRGTQAYGDGPDRLASRSTASHSTVQIGGREQVEIWGGFRVGWRGRPVLEEAVETAAGVRIAGRFAWRRGAHSRTVHAIPDGRLRVDDVVRSARVTDEVVARLWLPEARLADDEGTFVTAGRGYRIAALGARLDLLPSTWFPSQGLGRPALVAEIRPDGGGESSFSTTLEVVD